GGKNYGLLAIQSSPSRSRNQKVSFRVNSITRGEPTPNTPEPRPRRFVAGCGLVVPFGEPGGPSRTLLKGAAGPSKLAKLDKLKKETPGRSSILSFLKPQLRLRSKARSQA